MFAFEINPDTPTIERWDEIVRAAGALVDGEPDAIANMANVAALLWQFLPDVNWTGFYRLVEGELVLGPFQGKAACIRIPIGQGVCGAAARTRKTQLVDDVRAFEGHIACDADSRSELVVPLAHDGRLLGVIDIDSPYPARFDTDDAAGCERLARRIAAALAG
ncbi:GAF domain-containing protein [Novosphingopyxis sp.]|uniref:GAF domain-containing protein n=1 Tax=Novosphingopyxis sp. TaxID=2709690 RepID=UPI003B590E92